ncbi:fibronectin type III domain-containing protein [Halosimplex aquaticum]|uniref:Fibronectin type III domain-containing protein n=1 Tax=Halosimplex aquaticum TaxID=3026162 RepID=A0ABD5XX22_9EURY|nr:fibronectin type III domain-containing protein [Halosimplex aquaticum]
MPRDQGASDGCEGAGATDVDSATGGTSTTVLSPPAGLAVDGVTAVTATVTWSPPPDADEGGLDHYAVAVDGTKRADASRGTRRAAVANLAPGTTHTIGVTAVDAAGEASLPATVAVTTAEVTTAVDPSADPESNSTATDSTRRPGPSGGRQGTHTERRDL